MVISYGIRMHEPFNGLSHLAGALIACAGTVALVDLSRGDFRQSISFLIYGVSMVLLFLASGFYHLLVVEAKTREWLRKFDQCAIFLLIAGTYTPVCVLKMPYPWGPGYLAAVWAIALFGIAAQLLWARMPVALCVVLYVIMGWMSLFAIGPICRFLSPASIRWLFAGGIIYTIGCVVFASERPRLWPGKFGFHELWHLFVLAGAAAHFMMMISLVS